MKQTFSATLRLRNKADFNALRHGCRFACASLCFIYVRNKMNYARLGFAVSRRYGMAVVRNRFKRQLREVFRQHTVRSQGVDILVIPKSPYRNGTDTKGDMQSGLDRIFYRMKGDNA